MLSNEVEIFQHLSFCKTHHSIQTVYYYQFLAQSTKSKSSYSAEKGSSGFYGSILVMQEFKVELSYRYRNAS